MLKLKYRQNYTHIYILTHLSIYLSIYLNNGSNDGLCVKGLLPFSCPQLCRACPHPSGLCFGYSTHNLTVTVYHFVLISVVSRHSRWLFFNEKALRAQFTLPAEQQKAGRQSQQPTGEHGGAFGY